jgi:hypothetical protein
MNDPQPQELPPEEGQPHVPHGNEPEAKPREAKPDGDRQRVRPPPRRGHTPAVG